MKPIPYVFLKFVFWQLWPVGCAGCKVFGCFWQTRLCWNLGQQFFSGPWYIVNPQLPAVGQTSKKHTVPRSRIDAELKNKILPRSHIFTGTNLSQQRDKKSNFFMFHRFKYSSMPV